MKVDKSTAAKLLAAVSVACALGLQYGFLRFREVWEPTTFALLHHGALFAAAVSCALAWRHEETDFRHGVKLLLLIVALIWMNTWFEPLQDLVAWVKTIRYLFLEA